MRLPELSEPHQYSGLYVFDFGEWTAVGYTADEIGVLLESEQYRDGKVYRIHRVSPDGQMELQGVSPARFQVESGMFFYRAGRDAARADYESLCALARDSQPPCRAYVHLAERPSAEETRYVVALIYPAEFDDDMGRWLLEIGFAGGDVVEGGASHVSNYLNEDNRILEREQLWSAGSTQSRSPEEVLATVRRAVQR